MSRYELIVFDWDGTLMDSAGLIVHCVQEAARDIGVTPPTPSQARSIIGLGLGEALREALPQLPSHRHTELAARFRHHYLARDHELQLFPGAAAMVERLAARGRRLGVATGKSRQGLQRAMEQSCLRRFFDAVRCADDCPSKPHPQMLLELMQEIDVAAERTLMIGDATHDLTMAREAGVAAVAVSYGAHERQRLQAAQPLYCAASVVDLAAWLEANA